MADLDPAADDFGFGITRGAISFMFDGSLWSAISGSNLFVFLLVAVALYFYLDARNSRKRNARLLEKLAEKYGGSTMESDGITHCGAVIPMQFGDVVISSFPEEENRNRTTLLECPLNLSYPLLVQIFTESSLSLIGIAANRVKKAFGQEKFYTGSPAFDEVFEVDSEQKALCLGLLSGELQEALLFVRKGRPLRLIINSSSCRLKVSHYPKNVAGYEQLIGVLGLITEKLPS